MELDKSMPVWRLTKKYKNTNRYASIEVEEGTRSCGIAPAGTLATAGAQFTRFTGTKVQALLVRKYTRSCGIAPAGTLATAGAFCTSKARKLSTSNAIKLSTCGHVGDRRCSVYSVYSRY
jgi:hypothetical protein